MSKQIVRVGTRGSELALTQVKEIEQLIQEVGISARFDAQTYETAGDLHKDIPLDDDTVPDDFFTNTLDRAILDDEIDIAIHSAKDLPERMHEDLRIIVLTKSADESDCYVGNSTIANLAGGTKVGTSATLRKAALAQLNPGLDIVDIRGTIKERMDLIQQGKVEGIIVATIAMKRLGLEKKIKEVMTWETTPLQGSLAIVAHKNNETLKSLFEPLDIRRHYGSVTLVGAGPGDPELITIKGVKALEEADVVFYDYLAHPHLLDYAPDARKIYVGKRKGEHTLPQHELSKQLRQNAIDGKQVVRLKGGDPLIFGRGAEEITHLRVHGIDVNVIPGISSATGILSRLNIPLTARDVSSSVAFVSGHGKEESSSRPEPIDIPDTDTIIFLMGLTKLKAIVNALTQKDWPDDTPMMVVSRGTCWNERIVEGNLKNITRKVDDADLKPPALIVVGQVLKYYQPATMDEKRILFTGTNPEKYNALGQIIHHPMIKLTPRILTDSEIIEVSGKLSGIDFMLLTSPYAVESLCGQIKIQQDRPYKILVIGEETSRRLQNFNVSPDFASPVETSEGFFDCIMQKYDVVSKNILFPRSAISNPYLTDHLTEAGARVEELTMYENLKPTKRDLPKETIHKVVFTSPTTVHNFLGEYGKIPEEWQILSKGPTTQKCLEDAGYKSDIVIL